MGILSDRLGRAKVIVLAAGISTLCSFLFGWSIGWPFFLVIALGLVYAFFVLGDSPVLSAGLTEVVQTSYLGAAYGLRSLLGFGAGSLSPMLFGAILDWTNPGAAGGQYAVWGWAYGNLGIAGIFAVLSARQLGKFQINSKG
jgi:MFS family permease